MIKRPKEINKIMTKLGNEGYEVYCAGQCVTASYVGDDPQDWDLYTDCPQEKILEFFPEGEALGKRTTRLDYTVEVKAQDIHDVDHLEGIVADIVTLKGSIEDQLKIYDLTVEAIAEHPQKSPVDPYGGREDIKKKLLKATGDAGKAFQKNPEKILKVIRYVSLYDFDLSKELSQTISENAGMLKKADKEEVLYEMLNIINGKYAGKALKMLAGLNLLPGIVGEKAAVMNRREAEDYKTLAKNIDQVKQVPLRRMGLFYLCFDKHYEDAVEYLPYEGLDREYLLDAKKLVVKICFQNTDATLKSFIYKLGWDKYHYIDRLSKAQMKVFDLYKMKTEGRDHILREILQTKQPIFVEDLKIDAEDILEAGITDSPERAEFLLSLLPDVVHQNQKYNDRKTLLKYAKRFDKSRFRRTFRDVKWLR
ncbi:MAG: hypothetical protein Q4C25_08630 [Bacillota bacterium]|nr:hypothetical protein [Bacillota bacterium]